MLLYEYSGSHHTARKGGARGVTRGTFRLYLRDSSVSQIACVPISNMGPEATIVVILALVSALIRGLDSFNFFVCGRFAAWQVGGLVSEKLTDAE